jgi:hypothetical protein
VVVQSPSAWHSWRAVAPVQLAASMQELPFWPWRQHTCPAVAQSPGSSHLSEVPAHVSFVAMQE